MNRQLGTRRQLVVVALAAAIAAPLADLRGEAMTEQPANHVAAWSEVEGAVQVLRRGLAQSSPAAAAADAALERLDRALSIICPSQRESGEATAAAPSGPVTGPETRPEPSERDLRERLTMQTHRPAGPVGSSAAPSENDAEQGLTDPCLEAWSAAAAARAATDEGAPSEEALIRLEAALAHLRNARP